MSGGWIGKHKKEILGALALGGGAMFLPGLLGAGASAAGGAAAGGAGAAGGLAGGLGAGAADELMGGSLLSGYGAGPLAQGVDKLSLLAGNIGLTGDRLQTLGKAATVGNLLLGGGGQQQPLVPAAAPVGGAPAIVPNFPSLYQTYGQPVMNDEERKRRLLAQLQMLQQTGGLPYG